MLKTVTYDLATVFEKRIVERPAGFLVTAFNGVPGTVYVKLGTTGDRVELTAGQVVVHPMTDKWFYVVNTKAQTGTLTLLLASEDALGSLSRPTQSPPNPTAIAQGAVDVGTVATQFPAQAVPGGRAVVVTADPGNTDVIYIGGAGVTTATGHKLNAADSIELFVSNVSAIYAVAAVTGQKARYIVEVDE